MYGTCSTNVACNCCMLQSRIVYGGLNGLQRFLAHILLCDATCIRAYQVLIKDIGMQLQNIKIIVCKFINF